MAQSSEDRESRLLKIVESIAISPEDAQAIAEQYLNQSRSKHPGDPEWSHQLRAADQVVVRYARMAGMVGGSTSLTGIIPGLGTAVAVVGGATADTAVSMKLQVDMCMCLAAVFGYDIRSEDARYLVFLIAATGSLQRAGVEAGSRLGSQAGVRMLNEYLRGATLQAVKHAFRRVGFTFTRKAIAKAIPFGVGVAIGAGANYGLTRYVGREAKRWFVIDTKLQEESDESSHTFEEL